MLIYLICRQFGYNWNIVESGVKHHKPNRQFVFVFVQKRANFKQSLGDILCLLRFFLLLLYFTIETKQVIIKIF